MRVFIKATQAKLSENWKTRWKLEGTENKGIVRCWIQSHLPDIQLTLEIWECRVAQM